MTPFSDKECSWMHNTSCASTLTSTPQLLTLLHKRDATVPPAWQWEFSLGHHTGKWCLCASNLQERVQFERNMLRSGLYFCQHNEKFLIVDPERQCLLDLFHLLSCNNYSRHLLLANLIMRVLFRLSHLVKVRKIKCSLFDIEKVTQVVTSLSTVNQNHDFVITITPTKVVVLPKNNSSGTQDVNPCTLLNYLHWWHWRSGHTCRGAHRSMSRHWEKMYIWTKKPLEQGTHTYRSGRVRRCEFIRKSHGWTLQSVLRSLMI